MALFDKLDELAKSAGEGAKKAGEKAGAFIESKKMEFKVAEIEGKIVELKAKIGDIYWQKYISGETIDITASELCGQIQGKQNEIAALKSEKDAGEATPKNNVTDEKFCQNCGTKIDTNAAFCPSCGMKAN